MSATDKTTAVSVQLSSNAQRMFSALQVLCRSFEPHTCGGFSLDDIELQMGRCFTGDEILFSCLDELIDAGLVRSAGEDEDLDHSLCYEIA